MSLFTENSAKAATGLRRIAREYLSDAIDELSKGRRDRAAYSFKEWRRLMTHAKRYGRWAQE